jgi:3-dehydroquinate dehydratase I
MICIAISDKSINKCLATLDRCELAEIRLDLTEFDEDQIKQIFSHSTPTIATCRPDKKGIQDQLRRLMLAIDSGAKYVDLEFEAELEQREKIMKYAKAHNCKIIISYHNFIRTLPSKELHQIAEDCFKMGADIAKVATQVNSIADAANLLSLYNINKPIVAIGMGESGKLTRIIAPLLGAEFTFAAMDDGNATAPGQIKYQRMKEITDYLDTIMK